MIKLTVNGRDVELEQGATLLDGTKAFGAHIPTLCHYPGLPAHSVCRMCLVEVEGEAKPQPACSTPATDGAVIETDTASLQDFRATSVKWLLARHPNDCMRCEVNGDCQLQRLLAELTLKAVSAKSPANLVLTADTRALGKLRRMLADSGSITLIAEINRDLAHQTLPNIEEAIARA